MSEPINLGAVRADRSEKASDWTPVDMLRSLLTEWAADPSKAPEDAVIVCDVGKAYRYVMAGPSRRAQHIGMLAIAWQSIIHDGFLDEEPDDG